jgi:alanine racemase
MQKITQHAFPDFTLQPVARWKTRIMCIKKISAGKSIGYDRTAYAQQNTTVALLPIGYDDGYNPFLSNKALVGIDNCYAPIIGRVAMNVTTIDITHIKNAQVGSIVTLIGSDQNYNALTLAQSVQINNPRYITTNIKASIPRIVIE